MNDSWDKDGTICPSCPHCGSDVVENEEWSDGGCHYRYVYGKCGECNHGWPIRRLENYGGAITVVPLGLDGRPVGVGYAVLGE